MIINALNAQLATNAITARLSRPAHLGTGLRTVLLFQAHQHLAIVIPVLTDSTAPEELKLHVKQVSTPLVKSWRAFLAHPVTIVLVLAQELLQSVLVDNTQTNKQLRALLAQCPRLVPRRTTTRRQDKPSAPQCPQVTTSRKSVVLSPALPLAAKLLTATGATKLALSVQMATFVQKRLSSTSGKIVVPVVPTALLEFKLFAQLELSA